MRARARECSVCAFWEEGGTLTSRRHAARARRACSVRANSSSSPARWSRRSPSRWSSLSISACSRAAKSSSLLVSIFADAPPAVLELPASDVAATPRSLRAVVLCEATPRSLRAVVLCEAGGGAVAHFSPTISTSSNDCWNWRAKSCSAESVSSSPSSSQRSTTTWWDGNCLRAFPDGSGGGRSASSVKSMETAVLHARFFPSRFVRGGGGWVTSESSSESMQIVIGPDISTKL